jgi:tetratricopeptide (TPR) repeat protein
MQADAGDLKGAMANLLQALSLCAGEAAANPASAEIRGDLGVFHFHLADMLEKAGRTREALQHYETALSIEHAMSDSDPKNLDKRGNVADDWVKVSDLHLGLGEFTEALDGYQRALAIWESLVQATPDDADLRSQLALTREKIGAVYLRRAIRRGSSADAVADWRAARAWYQKSLDIWSELKQQKKLSSEYDGKPAEVAQQISKCERAIPKSGM